MHLDEEVALLGGGLVGARHPRGGHGVAPAAPGAAAVRHGAARPARARAYIVVGRRAGGPGASLQSQSIRVGDVVSNAKSQQRRSSSRFVRNCNPRFGFVFFLNIYFPQPNLALLGCGQRETLVVEGWGV